MRMLYGLSEVEEGKLELFGSRIVGLTPPEIKAKLGVVPQEDSLDPDLSVLENLELYGNYFGLSRQEARIRGRKLLAFMDLTEKEQDNVEFLSGGLKRRLVIARALLNKPQLVILDEPTTGLDPQARRLVWQKLRQLKDQGTTLILTTHYMEEAAQLCDRLLVMHEGEILAEGSPSELIARYLPPFVVEVHLAMERLPQDIREKAATMGARVEMIADNLFLFSAYGRELWERVEEMGLPQHACHLRSTGLEDVFLLLTRKREEE